MGTGEKGALDGKDAGIKTRQCDVTRYVYEPNAVWRHSRLRVGPGGKCRLERKFEARLRTTMLGPLSNVFGAWALCSKSRQAQSKVCLRKQALKEMKREFSATYFQGVAFGPMMRFGLMSGTCHICASLPFYVL